MSHQPGSIYKIGGRRYVDSQAIYNFAAAHEVVAQHDGWRLITGGGAVVCARVENRPELPRQRGSLYELSVEGGASLKAQRAVWLSHGLVQPGGAFETWPGDAPENTACGCGKTCGCGPCQHKHATGDSHS